MTKARSRSEEPWLTFYSSLQLVGLRVLSATQRVRSRHLTREIRIDVIPYFLQRLLWCAIATWFISAARDQRYLFQVRLQGDFAKSPEKRFNYKHCFDALFRVCDTRISCLKFC